MPDKKVNLGFRTTSQRARELRVISAHRGEKIQTMLENGLDLYLNPKSDSQPPRSIRGDKSDAKIAVPHDLVGVVESFLSWLGTPPDTEDRKDMRAFILKRMGCEDPYVKREREAKRKNAG